METKCNLLNHSAWTICKQERGERHRQFENSKIVIQDVRNYTLVQYAPEKAGIYWKAANIVNMVPVCWWARQPGIVRIPPRQARAPVIAM